MSPDVQRVAATFIQSNPLPDTVYEYLLGADEWWLIKGFTFTMANDNPSGELDNIVLTIAGVTLFAFEEYFSLSIIGQIVPGLDIVVYPEQLVGWSVQGGPTATFSIMVWGERLGILGPAVMPAR